MCIAATFRSDLRRSSSVLTRLEDEPIPPHDLIIVTQTLSCHLKTFHHKEPQQCLVPPLNHWKHSCRNSSRVRSTTGLSCMWKNVNAASVCLKHSLTMLTRQSGFPNAADSRTRMSRGGPDSLARFQQRLRELGHRLKQDELRERQKPKLRTRSLTNSYRHMLASIEFWHCSARAAWESSTWPKIRN